MTSAYAVGMWRRALIALSLCALPLGVAACGGGDDNAAAPADTAGTTIAASKDDCVARLVLLTSLDVPGADASAAEGEVFAEKASETLEACPSKAVFDESALQVLIPGVDVDTKALAIAAEYRRAICNQAQFLGYATDAPVCAK